MVFELQSLLDLRRDAESVAKHELELATADLMKQEEEQARLLARWQAGCRTFDSERARLQAGPAPATVAQGQARQGYLGRLREEAHRLKEAAEEHLTAVLDVARSAHEAARSRYQAALCEREALSNLEQRAQAERVRIAARRAEDAAADLASTARRRR